MKATKIFHRNEARIRIDFPYNQSFIALLKQIPDSKWSRTYNAWHIPYTAEAFKKLIEMFPEIEYPDRKDDLNNKDIPKLPTSSNAEEKASQFSQRNKIIINVIGRQIIINMPKNEADVRFVAALKYSRWDKSRFCWIIPNYPGNLDLINDYFNKRIDELNIHENLEIRALAQVREVSKSQILIIKGHSGRMKLIFHYNPKLASKIKTLPYSSWDSKNKWWSIPLTDILLQQITNFAQESNLEIIIEEETKQGEGLPRPQAHLLPNYRSCPEEYLSKLIELRYSDNTLKTYKNAFEEFINYYHTFDIKVIDETMIISYLRYLVTERKVSTSYQNQAINAIKFYYEKVLGGQRKFYFIDRPRKEKTIPNVLSVEEITKLIKSIENIKHKAIIMTAYSAGLRISELVDLKITDIDSQRNQIKIVQGKGRKDRYTLLSPRLTDILRKYYLEYKPKQWLFEGAKGAKYSRTSIYNIVHKAAEMAGIRKKMSMHTLRHSFATHLLENGTDLRYIQSLMGHESSKTTEIYTHITTKGFDQLKSPLDNLDI